MVDESNGDVRGREQEEMTPLIPWVFFEKLTVTNPGVEGVEKRHKGGVVKKMGLILWAYSVLGAKDIFCEIPHQNRFWISKKGEKEKKKRTKKK